MNPYKFISGLLAVLGAFLAGKYGSVPTIVVSLFCGVLAAGLNATDARP